MGVRATIAALLEQAGYRVKSHPSAASCLDDDISSAGCVVCDIRMPQMDGLQFLAALAGRNLAPPVIFVTGHADVQLAVKAMKSGAVDFIEKPFDASTMLDSVAKALLIGAQSRSSTEESRAAQDRLSRLSARERQVLELLVAGQSHKLAARQLGISHRTVEIHRARIMAKMETKNFSDLVRVALAAPQAPSVPTAMPLALAG
jgi:two-component system response regulator FixJ